MNLSRAVLPLLLIVMLLAAPAAAYQKDEFQNMAAFHFIPQTGYAVYQVNLFDLDPGTTHLELTGSEGTYKLDIVATKSSLAWWNFDLTLTYPNSTTDTASIGTWGPLNTDYDLKIQPLTADASDIFDVLAIQVYCGLIPMNANFRGAIYTTVLIFNDIQGTTPGYCDLTVYSDTLEGIRHILNNDLIYILGNTLSNVGGEILYWSVDAVKAAVAMIPGVGEYFVDIIDISAAILYELSWYLWFFLIAEPELTVGFLEFFCIGEAVIASRGGARGIAFLLRRVLDNHIRAYHFFLNMFRIMYEMILWVVEAFANVVNALKPI